MLPVGLDQFADVQRAGSIDGQATAVGDPLGDQPVVLRAALGAVVRAQQEVPAVQGDDGLARLLVKAVGGNGIVCKSWHGKAPGYESKNGIFRLGTATRAALPTVGRYV
jgi:hypothetical protein